MRRLAAVLLAIIITVSVPAVAVPTMLRWRVQAALHRDLAAEAVTVRLLGAPTAVLTGRFRRLQLRVQRAHINTLVVQELSGEFAPVQIDSRAAWRDGRLVVHYLGPGQVVLRVHERDLAKYLEGKGIRNARVRLREGRLMLEGTVLLLNAQVPVTIEGDLSIRNGREVVLTVQTLAIGGVGMPEEVATVLLTPVNPLLTVEHLPVPVRLREITAEHGILTLTAESSS